MTPANQSISPLRQHMLAKPTCYVWIGSHHFDKAACHERQTLVQSRLPKIVGTAPCDIASSISNTDKWQLSGLRAGQRLVTLRSTLRLEVAHVMIRCHLSVLMGRDKLRISDVAQRTGLNRSTVTAMYNETATRVELPAIEKLCTLFHCQVGELFELVPSEAKGQP